MIQIIIIKIIISFLAATLPTPGMQSTSTWWSRSTWPCSLSWPPCESYSHFDNMVSVLFFSFIGKAQALPTTSYPKMIDIWLIATMMVPFLEIALHRYSQVQADIINWSNFSFCSYRCSVRTQLLNANNGKGEAEKIYDEKKTFSNFIFLSCGGVHRKGPKLFKNCQVRQQTITQERNANY